MTHELVNGQIDPVNISLHLRLKEVEHPEATGALSSVLENLSVVAKSVSHLVSTGPIKDIYGYAGRRNIQGENVLKLDDLANIQFKNRLQTNPYIAGFASEEDDTYTAFENGRERKYVIWFDPLDGSSNFDTNVSIGSIFAIYKRKSETNHPLQLEDFLQEGTKQVCSGYFLYGPGTMFVYTTGNGVYGFTLDPTIGEFVLPKEYSQIKTPEKGNIYSTNEGYSDKWTPKVEEYISRLKESKYTSRYIGSLVADFHRNLLKGGVFLYPDYTDKPNGKLRLCCELFPLSYIAEQAGGMATDVRGNRILNIKPTELHQRSPVIIGSRHEVELFSKFERRIPDETHF